VSLIERGQLGHVTVGTLRRVGTALQIEIRLELRWRGGELFRLLAEGHAAMGETVTRRLVESGWEVRPEVSFSHFGERGVVDLVAWHGASRSLLLVELKTELVDLGDLLATMDRRRRLATVIAEGLGWSPATVASWVVLTDTRTNRRRVANHAAVLRAAFPTDGRSMPAWLRKPDRAIAGLSFLPYPAEARSGTRPGTARRVARGRGERFRRPDPAN